MFFRFFGNYKFTSKTHTFFVIFSWIVMFVCPFNKLKTLFLTFPNFKKHWFRCRLCSSWPKYLKNNEKVQKTFKKHKTPLRINKIVVQTGLRRGVWAPIAGLGFAQFECRCYLKIWLCDQFPHCNLQTLLNRVQPGGGSLVPFHMGSSSSEPLITALSTMRPNLSFWKKYFHTKKWL